MKTTLFFAFLVIQLSAKAQSIEGKWFFKTTAVNLCSRNSPECLSRELYKDSCAMFDPKLKCFYTLTQTFKKDGTYEVITKYYLLKNTVLPSNHPSYNGTGTWSYETNGMVKITAKEAIVPPFGIYRIEWGKEGELIMYWQL